MTKVSIAKLSDLANGKLKEVTIAGQSILLFEFDGQVKAYFC
jgi:nitrite reductase/ring-hydroxylating ferredoxin subunit